LRKRKTQQIGYDKIPLVATSSFYPSRSGSSQERPALVAAALQAVKSKLDPQWLLCKIMDLEVELAKWGEEVD